MERIDYVVLYTDDVGREVAFYRDVLGLPFRLRDRGYAEFGLRNLRLGLFDRSGLGDLIGPEGAERRPEGEILFLVPEVDAWAERLRAAGSRILSGPADRPWGHRTLHFLDPGGHVVELAQEIPRTRPRP